ncbi:hypothetical protein [Faecalibaculum rodentium]|uniref:hypothetical protein n=1 Tax=Faecalibaculum rodentium TaxID=1702221 RepID=UPI00272FE19C|nr:hypothetical protein [Faecalibaculum rodentium]
MPEEVCRYRKAIAIDDYDVIDADMVVGVHLEENGALVIRLSDGSTPIVDLSDRSKEVQHMLFCEFIDFLYPEPFSDYTPEYFFSFPVKLDEE